MHPILFNLGENSVPTQLVIIFIALLVGVFLLLYQGKRRGIHWKILTITFIAILCCGLLGARLFTLLTDIPWYTHHFSQAYLLSFGGLHMYGGIIGALLGCLWVAYWYDETWLQLADIAFLVALPVMALCAIGNYFHGTGFGSITTLNLQTTEHSASVTALNFARYPVQLFLAIWLALLYLGLQLIQPFKMFHGQILALILIIYPLSKMILDLSLSDGTSYPILFDLQWGRFELNLEQITAVAMIISGSSLFFTLKSRRLS